MLRLAMISICRVHRSLTNFCTTCILVYIENCSRNIPRLETPRFSSRRVLTDFYRNWSSCKTESKPNPDHLSILLFFCRDCSTAAVNTIGPLFFTSLPVHTLSSPRLLLFRSAALILNPRRRRVASTPRAASALPARCKFNDSADNRETTYGRKVAIYLREDITGFAFNSLATFHQPRLTPDRVTRLPCKVTPDLPALPSFYR